MVLSIVCFVGCRFAFMREFTQSDDEVARRTLKAVCARF